MNPYPVWAWLEWRGHRAHFLAPLTDDLIWVEYLSGFPDIWPLAECRRIGPHA